MSEKPCASSAWRRAPTRPSIMSDGATTSAPAAAWETAVRASRSSEGSFRMRSPDTTPQCPWDIYSHRQTSVKTSRSGLSAFRARTARCTMPSSAYAPRRLRRLCVSGRPNSRTAGRPSAAICSASTRRASTVSCATPGREEIGRRSRPAPQE